MPKYVPYVRTAEGYIERISYAIFNSSDEHPPLYIHEQPVSGWPESRVFWAHETGPSVGIAPIPSCTPDAERDVNSPSPARSAPSSPPLSIDHLVHSLPCPICKTIAIRSIGGWHIRKNP